MRVDTIISYLTDLSVCIASDVTDQSSDCLVESARVFYLFKGFLERAQLEVMRSKTK